MTYHRGPLHKRFHACDSSPGVENEPERATLGGRIQAGFVRWHFR